MDRKFKRLIIKKEVIEDEQDSYCYRWKLGILAASVVASINITYAGGSSSVFNSALNAPIDNI